MKGFFKWFKSGTRMKRWMLVILIGIVLCCYGVSEIIVAQTLSILEVIKVAVLFILGFGLIVVGLVYSQKRVLEILIEETDSRMNSDNKNINVNSLIFNKKIYNDGPKIVVIGGGTGLNSVLKGLKEYTNNITAIVEYSNFGKQYTLDGIIALSENEEEMAKVLRTKIGNNGETFGDLYLDVIGANYENRAVAMESISNTLNITGKMLPVTLDNMKVCAELEDGTIVEDRDKLPQIVMDKVTRINRVFITPSNCRTAPDVIDSIMEADAVIIGPGSLYTNVIPNLLIRNVSKAIQESKAKKIYIGNIMTEPGQTDDFSLYDHIKAILDHARNRIIDYCIYDTGEVVPEYIKKYNQQGADLVEQDIKKIKNLGIKVIQRSFAMIEGETIRHNPSLVADSIIELICDDMIFRNMQNGSQFVKINDKLKKSNSKRKKREKERQRELKKEGKHHKAKRMNNKKQSKFAAKYNERIKSIQESEELRREKLESLGEKR